MIKAIATNDDTREWTFGETDADDFFRFVEIEHVDVVAVRHDRRDALLVESQHVGDDGLLAFVENTGFRTLLHQDVDLVVSHRRVAAMARTDQLQQQR